MADKVYGPRFGSQYIADLVKHNLENHIGKEVVLKDESLRGWEVTHPKMQEMS